MTRDEFVGLECRSGLNRATQDAERLLEGLYIKRDMAVKFRSQKEPIFARQRDSGASRIF